MTGFIQYENGQHLCTGKECYVAVVLSLRPGWLGLIPVVGMFIAGTWDDLQGDERPRGFKGHLAAMRGGALTGGLVKMGAGAAVGLVTMAGGLSFHRIDLWILSAAAIALSANLINLLDRAPGRALKVFLLIALTLAFLVPEWRVVGAGSLGAAVALLRLDLSGKGMLGDAGANALGGVLGLGLVLGAFSSVRDPVVDDPRFALVLLSAALLALNLASERWSFSKVIENTPWLARLDHLGRK
jgi:hypothetical protein